MGGDVMNESFKATLMALSLGEQLQPKPRSLSSVYVICPACQAPWTHALMRPEDAPAKGVIHQYCPRCDGREA